MNKIYKKIKEKIFYPFKRRFLILRKEGIKKEIKCFKYKNLLIYEIIDGEIFTNSVDDAAYIKKNYILEGPSYQYRNSINSNIRNNTILKSGVNRFSKKIRGNILSLISGGPAKHNYGHWLFDVLSRLLIIKKINRFKKIDYYYVPAFKFQFQKDTLHYLNIKKKQIISSENNKYIKADKIISTDHPFEHRFDKIPKHIFEDVRRNFIKLSSYSKIKKYDKIYFERDYSSFDLNNLKKFKNERILVNNKAVKKFLESNGFHTYKAINLSFADQIKIFSNAKIIVSMFGAELSNLVFCKPKTRVIEIKTNKKLTDYTNISNKCRLKHHQINIKPIYKTISKQNGILECPIEKLKIAIS